MDAELVEGWNEGLRVLLSGTRWEQAENQELHRHQQGFPVSGAAEGAVGRKRWFVDRMIHPALTFGALAEERGVRVHLVVGNAGLAHRVHCW